MKYTSATKGILAVSALCLLSYVGSVSAQSGGSCLATWVPAIDGCTYGDLDSANLHTSFTAACNRHDICFRELGQTKRECDVEFRSKRYQSCWDDARGLIEDRVSALQSVMQRCGNGLYAALNPESATEPCEI